MDEARASTVTDELRAFGYGAYRIPGEGANGDPVWHVLVRRQATADEARSEEER